MNKFEQTMLALGYRFEEQEGNKVTFRKRTQFSDLALVFDLELKTINPILVPSSLILYERDLVTMFGEFKSMREDAEKIAKLSSGKYRVLN